MFAHAAGDIFAHTYVNRYAGNFWHVTQEGTEAERRHFLLEDTSRHLQPPLKDAAASDVVLHQFGDLRGVPKEFIARAYFLNEAATKQAFKCAPHLELLRREMIALHDLIKEDGLLPKIEKLIKNAFAENYLGRKLTDEELAVLRDISNLSLKGVDIVDHAAHGLVETAIRLNAELERRDKQKKYKMSTSSSTPSARTRMPRTD